MVSLANECVPFWEDGDRITGQASADVTGKRFLKVSGNRVSGPGLATTADGGAYPVAHADAGGLALGVSSQDKASGGFLTLITGHGHIVPVTADGAIAAFQRVMVGATGKAKALGNSAATVATADTGVVGTNNAITWTTVATGENANTTTVQIKGSTGNNVALSIVRVGDDIVVTPATDGGGAITSTATLVLAAIAGSNAAGFVTGANKGASSGAGLVAAQGPVQFAGGADAAAAGLVVGVCMTAAIDGADAEIRLL